MHPHQLSTRRTRRWAGYRRALRCHKLLEPIVLLLCEQKTRISKWLCHMIDSATSHRLLAAAVRGWDSPRLFETHERYPYFQHRFCVKSGTLKSLPSTNGQPAAYMTRYLRSKRSTEASVSDERAAVRPRSSKIQRCNMLAAISKLNLLLLYSYYARTRTGCLFAGESLCRGPYYALPTFSRDLSRCSRYRPSCFGDNVLHSWMERFVEADNRQLRG